MDNPTDTLAKVTELLELTYAGPIFGPGEAFAGTSKEHMRAATIRTGSVARVLAERLDATLRQARPADSAALRRLTIAEVTPKASCFVPALTNLELRAAGLGHQTDTAEAVSYMYIGDQQMDRGNKAMVLAAEHEYAADPGKVPRALQKDVASWRLFLGNMPAAIQRFTLPEDYQTVLACFELVLRDEAAHHRLSSTYEALTTDSERAAFLAEYAEQLALLTVEDAGFQSVTASLYSLYRRDDPTLPTVEEVHTHPEMTKLIQMCNTAARVADERGDWWMDAGHDPAIGVFTLNPFNQYHSGFMQAFCDQAYLDNTETIAQLQESLQHFHEDRDTNGAFITDTFFAHVRNHLLQLREKLPHYAIYLRLCMRVLEISHVNMMGDIRLAAAKQRH